MPVLAASDLRLAAGPLDYALLAIYFAIVLGIGYLARRSVSTSLDFFLSGRSLPAWVTGLAFIAANLGALELLGMAANGAQHGIPTMHYYWVGAIPAMVFLGLVMMPFYYGSKVRSVPEFLRRRFGMGAHLFNALSFAAAQMLIAGVNLYALALLLNLMLGWPIPLSIVIAALVVLAYTTLGGLSAAIYNEVLQFFVIVAALLPVTIVGLVKVGGWNGLVDKISAGPGGAGQLEAWPATGLTGIGDATLSVLGLVFGLGFVLSFGYWTTNFAEVQRAMSAKSMSAARRTPIIGAYPKALIPAIVVIPGMIAAVVVPQMTALKAGAGADGIEYNHALPLLIRELLPNGALGIAITGLLASFMAGVAANVSSFNTVFTYDLWQHYIVKGRPDAHYLRVGRWATVGGMVVAIGTAFIAAGFSNIMDYIQALFSIFNAPLFATFILGMFWKRMTPAAGWSGLVAGTVAALVMLVLTRSGVVDLPGQGASFVGAGLAFVTDIAVSVAVTLGTRPRPDRELVGLVYGLTPKADRKHSTEGADAGWYRSPVLLGVGVLVLTVALNIIFS
ncbi:solute:Na+ symporter, SSS family protein [Longimycelium tulufanense]|uniref:Solute:Na+ symporter, SSS family protein n=1 Tax=Longimycelium tulufanense TaxID=907463 RepID=A0A8J3C8T1_9PSEU|nr:sodium:solute symporter family protein [Longimycelium tulufanense]GGM35385.1 solute:Na+ symporter, SSS family protein [Longimycelium tulufanense]